MPFYTLPVPAVCVLVLSCDLAISARRDWPRFADAERGGVGVGTLRYVEICRRLRIRWVQPISNSKIRLPRGKKGDKIPPTSRKGGAALKFFSVYFFALLLIPSVLVSAQHTSNWPHPPEPADKSST